MSSHTLVSTTIWRKWLVALACIGALAWLAATATAQGERPAKVSDLTATVIADKQVKFTWDDPKDSGLDRYSYRFDRSSADPEEWDQPWKNTQVKRPAKATSWGLEGSCRRPRPLRHLLLQLPRSKCEWLEF